jgi:hypothetical protein
MPSHLLPVILAATLLVSTAHPATAANPDKPRLRFLSTHVAELVDRGEQSSPVFRRLANRLRESDVVVYIECTQVRTGLHGQLTFLSAAAGLRYVLVRINWTLDARTQIAILGHELQHAVEIADHPDIVSAQTLAAAYTRFGIRRGGIERQNFDTGEAVLAGRRVWSELASENITR